MNIQSKKIAKLKERNLINDRELCYLKLRELVEEILRARIIADAIWKHKLERAVQTGFHNPIISFSQVALENFTVQQLWKLFDRKSVFNVWYVAEHLSPTLVMWLKKDMALIENDRKLIEEWRHIVIGHRSLVGYFAPDEHQKKFINARTSEKRLQNFLLDFLCQIKFETQQISLQQTMEELNFRLTSFEDHIKSEMPKVFK